jgi:hypothetical protein
MLENYNLRFETRGKFVFVPNRECNRRAGRLLAFGSTLELPDYFYHYRRGGHVEALYRHLEFSYFFRIDLKNFFYSIGRNRVARLLRQYGFSGSARTYAEWSSVRNPYSDGPKYALPIGFKQSPLLASLALWRSAVASAIEEVLHRGVFVSVYFDDLVGSSDDADQLRAAYDGIRDACFQANLVVNPEKLTAPSDAIVAFNCDLTQGRAEVTPERIKKFAEEDRGPEATRSFNEYCERVRLRNR